MREETRATDRFKPVKAITVALKSSEEQPVGFGIVADISAAGACVFTTVGLDVGAEVRLTLSFPNNQSVFTTGKVCWIERVRWLSQQDPNHKTVRYGMQFEPRPSTDSRLEALIAEHAAA